MRPNYFVFCEGETEMAYVKLLRSVFRVPLQIICRKSDSNISEQYINHCKRDYVPTQNDKTFLMFDLDVEGMLEHLKKIEDAILLVSNPCIELWFLLHYEDCSSEISTDRCIKKLSLHSSGYTKGTQSPKESNVLISNMDIACERAKRMTSPANPSSMVYLLIDALKEK